MKVTHLKIGAVLVVVGLVLGPMAWEENARSGETAPPDTLPSSACLDCHESKLGASAHDVAMPARVACVSCHRDVTAAHIDDPEAHRPRHPRELRADSLTAWCTTCHAHPHATNLAERDPHERADLSCTACHGIHDNHREGLLRDEEVALCEGCHPSARAQFARTSHHPVPDGVIKCSDCHMTVNQSAKQRTGSGPGGVCLTCHAMFAGPFPFEHQATVEYSAQDGGCLNCHEPHGSANSRLLKQSYEGTDARLCMQCHTVPRHKFNQKHGDAWANVPCNECHVDIHGSYESRRFLDPALQGEGCFQGSCHRF